MDLLVAVGALAVSTLFFWLAGDFPRMAADPGGLALFPRAVALITGIASAALIVQTLLSRHRSGLAADNFFASLSWSRLAGFFRANSFALLTFLLVGLFPFAINALGFMAAVALFSTFVLIASRLAPVAIATTAVLTTGGIYVAYALILGAILPTGYLF